MPTFLRVRTRNASGSPAYMGSTHSVFDDSVISTGYMVLDQTAGYVADEGGNTFRDGHYSGGGYFRLYRNGVRYEPTGAIDILTAKNGPRYSDARIIAGIPDRYQFDFTWNGNYNPENFDADSFGAEAWNRARPAQPRLSVLNSLLELREWPSTTKPKILKYRNTKAWADYHLAIQFGWLPLLSDVQNFVQNFIERNKQADQLIRDEDRPVRRRFELGSKSHPNSNPSVRGQSYGAVQSGMVTDAFAGVPTYEDSCEWGNKLWFSGRFRYHLPGELRDLDWRRALIMKIVFGTPSPSVVYNAIPWTWLIDYFSNVGDIISNMDNGLASTLTADYAFVMQTKYIRYTRKAYGYVKRHGGGNQDFQCSTQIVKETKERTIVNPFGPSFNDFGSLSDQQVGILGALGLSNLPSARGKY